MFDKFAPPEIVIVFSPTVKIASSPLLTEEYLAPEVILSFEVSLKPKIISLPSPDSY